MNPYLKQYQKNQLETATPEQILIMLYDGAIQYLNVARIEMTADKPLKDIQKIHNNIIKAQQIISEFQNTLNMDIGGEMAKNLYSLYDYLYTRLVDANVKKDVKALDEVLNHLKDLRTTWQKAIDIAKHEKDSHLAVDEDEDYDDTDIHDEEDSFISTEIKG